MYCKYCKNEIPEESSYCFHCGIQGDFMVEQLNISKLSKPSLNNTMNIDDDKEIKTSTIKIKKNKKWLVIKIFIGLIIIVSIPSILYLKTIKNKEEYMNWPIIYTNSNQEVFYVKHNTYTSYKQGPLQLASFYSAGRFYVSDNKLYVDRLYEEDAFIAEDVKDVEAYNNNGIVFTNYNMEHFYYSDGQLIQLKGNAIKRYTFGILSEGKELVYIDYEDENAKLWRVDLEGHQELLSEGINFEFIEIYEDKIYYIKETTNDFHQLIEYDDGNETNILNIDGEGSVSSAVSKKIIVIGSQQDKCWYILYNGEIIKQLNGIDYLYIRANTKHITLLEENINGTIEHWMVDNKGNVGEVDAYFEILYHDFGPYYSLDGTRKLEKISETTYQYTYNLDSKKNKQTTTITLDNVKYVVPDKLLKKLYYFDVIEENIFCVDLMTGLSRLVVEKAFDYYPINQGIIYTTREDTSVYFKAHDKEPQLLIGGVLRDDITPRLNVISYDGNHVYIEAREEDFDNSLYYYNIEKDKLILIDKNIQTLPYEDVLLDKRTVEF